jgi:hypothetical protein
MRLYATCINECPDSYEAHPIYNNLCYPKRDMSTHNIYVDSDLGSDHDGNGTYEKPFSNLSNALKSISAKHTNIILLSSAISLSRVSLQNSLNLLENTFEYSQITIKSANPSNPSIIKLYDPILKLSLPENTLLVIENVVFDGSESLLRGCETSYCLYCPYYYTDSISGLDYNEKNEVVDTSSWAKNCKNFKEHDFIYLNSSSRLILRVIVT